MYNIFWMILCYLQRSKIEKHNLEFIEINDGNQYAKWDCVKGKQ
jgi:hypothetical protein